MYLIDLHISHKDPSFLESMAGVGSWSAPSLPMEEDVVYGAFDPTDTSLMILASKQEPMKDIDDAEL